MLLVALPLPAMGADDARQGTVNYEVFFSLGVNDTSILGPNFVNNSGWASGATPQENVEQVSKAAAQLLCDSPESFLTTGSSGGKNVVSICNIPSTGSAEFVPYQWMNSSNFWFKVGMNPGDTEKQNCDNPDAWDQCAPGQDYALAWHAVDRADSVAELLGPAAFPNAKDIDANATFNYAFPVSDLGTNSWRWYTGTTTSAYNANAWAAFVNLGLTNSTIGVDPDVELIQDQTSQSTGPPQMIPVAGIGSIYTDIGYMSGGQGWEWVAHTWDSQQSVWAPEADMNGNVTPLTEVPLDNNTQTTVLLLPGMFNQIIKDVPFTPANMSGWNDQTHGELVPSSFSGATIDVVVDPEGRSMTTTTSVDAKGSGAYLGGADGLRTIIGGQTEPYLEVSQSEIDTMSADCKLTTTFNENANLCDDEFMWEFFNTKSHNDLKEIQWTSSGVGTVKGGAWDMVSGTTSYSQTGLVGGAESAATITTTTTVSFGASPRLTKSMAITDSLSLDTLHTTPVVRANGIPTAFGGGNVTVNVNLGGSSQFVLGGPSLSQAEKYGGDSVAQAVFASNGNGGYTVTMSAIQYATIEKITLPLSTDVDPPQKAAFDSPEDIEQGSTLTLVGTAVDADTVLIEIGNRRSPTVQEQENGTTEYGGQVMDGAPLLSQSVSVPSNGDVSVDLANFAIGWCTPTQNEPCRFLGLATASNSLGMTSETDDFLVTVKVASDPKVARPSMSISLDDLGTSGSIDTDAGEYLVEGAVTKPVGYDYSDCVYSISWNEPGQDATVNALVVLNNRFSHSITIAEDQSLFVEVRASCDANKGGTSYVNLRGLKSGTTDPGTNTNTTTNTTTTPTVYALTVGSVAGDISSSGAQVTVTMTGADCSGWDTKGLKVSVQVDTITKLFDVASSPGSCDLFLTGSDLTGITAGTHDYLITVNDADGNLVDTKSGKFTLSEQSVVDTTDEPITDVATQAPEDEGGLPGFSVILAVSGFLLAAFGVSSRKREE